MRYFGDGWKSGYARRRDKYRNYAKQAHDSLLKQKQKLNGVLFTSCAYDKVIIPDGAVVYCDPPYKGTTNKRKKTTEVLIHAR